MEKDEGINEFRFLEDFARRLGAVEAKVVPASCIVVEERVVWKCKIGCRAYGKKLVCPPFTPTAEEFRKGLRDYRYALLLKFESPAEAEQEVVDSVTRCMVDPNMPADMKEKSKQFWAAWNNDRKRILLAVLELERAVFNKGYPLALGFGVGACCLCEKCTLKVGECAFPTMARFNEHAVGVNVTKTYKNAGIPFGFPVKGKAFATTMVLID
jgi:predicted metal-binding protein